MTTAEIRRLGYSEIDYENMVSAGKLILQNNAEPDTVREYAEVMKSVLSKDVYDFMIEMDTELTKMVKETKLCKQDFFSVETHRNLFSTRKVNGETTKFFESPRLIYLRVTVQLYMPNMEKIKQSYTDFLAGKISCSTPTLINAGTRRPMMSSCFVDIVEDDGKKIGEEISNVMAVIKNNASQGIDLSEIRHSEMSNGKITGGVVPVVKLLASAVEYSKSQRKANATVFLNVWHIDIEDFMKLNVHIGDQEKQVKHVHPAIWTYDLFWKRVEQYNPDEQAGKWTLFCPQYVPKLLNLVGEDFVKQYIEYENDKTIPKSARKEVYACELVTDVLIPCLIRSGKPFVLNRDACTLKSNHRHLGNIGSNLCVEIFQHLDHDNFPTCNLHSLSLRYFAKKDKSVKQTPEDIIKCFDFTGLAEATRQSVDNLNAMMERNFFPNDKVEGDEIVKGKYHKTNDKYRAIAIGVSGFASALAKMDLSYHSSATKIFNVMTFACIYFNALCRSVDTSILKDPCEIHAGSPASEGLLQFDLWKEEFQRKGPSFFRKEEDDEPLSPTVWGQLPYQLLTGEIIEPSWDSLKSMIKKYGLYNSLVTAIMPTNNSAQALRNSENIEPLHSNLYSRETLPGNFTVINRYMIDDLKEIGLWNEKTLKYLRYSGGSLKNFDQEVINSPLKFPDFNGDFQRLKHIMFKYLTAREIKQKLLLELSADRGRYVDQGESHNVYLHNDKQDSFLQYQIIANKLGVKVHNYYTDSRTEEGINIGSEKSENSTCDMCSS